MDIRIDTRGDSRVAIVSGTAPLITDPRSATDLIAEACFSTDCHKLVIDSALLSDDFFVLRTGLAGEVLQRFTNYNVRLAIVGDFSNIDSKALRDFIRESNKGTQVLFLPDEQTALDRLHALS